MSFFEGFKPGDLIDGQYLVLKQLGKGGMGIVYKVKEGSWTNRLFALKILLPEGIRTSQIDKAVLNDLRKRFTREASLCMDLDHPNIVKVVGVRIFEENKVYLLMEYIDGENLSKWLNTHSTGFMRERWKIIADISDALQYAHEKQIYHRDVKPTNIMVAGSGQSRIVDFGLAKSMEQELGERSRLGGLGSGAYAAPEQWRGDPYDHRVDIYSLGIVCIEILMGRRPKNPIPGDILSELRERFNEPVSEVLEKATASAPSDRYHSIKEMFHALEKAQKSSVPIIKTKGDALKAGIRSEKTQDPEIQVTDGKPTKPLGKPAFHRRGSWFFYALLGTSVLVAAMVLADNLFQRQQTPSRIAWPKVISLDTGEFLHPVQSIFVLTPGERILIHAEVENKPDDRSLDVFFEAIFGTINAEGNLAAQYRAPTPHHSKDLIIIEASNDIEHYRKALGIDIQVEDGQMENPPSDINEGYDQQQWKGDLLQ